MSDNPVRTERPIERFRQDLSASLAAALDDELNPEAQSKIDVILAGLDDDPSLALEDVKEAFGPRIFGAVLLFHLEARTSLAGWAESMSTLSSLGRLSMRVKDLAWPAGDLHPAFEAAGVEWPADRLARFRAAAEQLRVASLPPCGVEHPDYPGEYRCTHKQGHDPIPDAEDPSKLWLHADAEQDVRWDVTAPTDPRLAEFRGLKVKIRQLIAGAPMTDTATLTEMQRELGELSLQALHRKTAGCEDWSARWCPIHGDCACGDDFEDSGFHDDCPLHGVGSEHAETGS